MLEFTGERVVEGQVPERIWRDHLSRYRFAARHVAQSMVLDVACGTGYGSLVLADEGGAATVVGIDVCREALQYARHHYHHARVDFVLGDATVLPAADGSVDVVVSLETIEHIAAYRTYLQEVRRVLGSGGRYIVSTPNAAFTSSGRTLSTSPFHAFEWDQAGFEALLAEYFSSIDIWGQRFLPRSLLIWPVRIVAALLRPGLYLQADGNPAVRQASRSEVPRYIVAVCSP